MIPSGLTTAFRLSLLVALPALVGCLNGPEAKEILSGPVAVFVGPTSEDIRVAQESRTDDEYASWVDHGTYYAYQIGKEIEGIGVRIVHSEELLLYFSLSGKTISHDLSVRDYAWSVVIFNGVDPPRESVFYDPDLIPYLEKGL